MRKPMSDMAYELMTVLRGAGAIGPLRLKALVDGRYGERMVNGTLYTMLKRLRDQGLVRSERARGVDGREVLYRITASGHKALDECVKLYKWKINRHATLRVEPSDG